MKKTLIALLLVAATAALTSPAHTEVVVIANFSVKAAVISKSDLKDVFTGVASSLRDGSHITPVVLKAGATQDEFLAAYIGKPDGAFRAGWRNLVFSGEATMPRQLPSDAAVVEYVAHTPGAIGYIAKASAHPGVKVLEVK
jgi:ABC-type phosphate transport system substrate-binding protein